MVELHAPSAACANSHAAISSPAAARSAARSLKAGVCAFVAEAEHAAAPPQREHADEPAVPASGEDRWASWLLENACHQALNHPGQRKRRRLGALGERIPFRGERRDRVIDVDRHGASVTAQAFD